MEFLPHTKPPRKYRKTFHAIPPLYLVRSNTKAHWFLRNKWLNNKRLNYISFYGQTSAIWSHWTSTSLAHSINARCPCEIFQSSFPVCLWPFRPHFAIIARVFAVKQWHAYSWGTIFNTVSVWADKRRLWRKKSRQGKTGMQGWFLDHRSLLAQLAQK